MTSVWRPLPRAEPARFPQKKGPFTGPFSSKDRELYLEDISSSWSIAGETGADGPLTSPA